MIIKEEIDQTIGTRGMWKARLKQAIETGKNEVSAHFRSVRDLDPEFHECAARVADLAVTGNKNEAVRMLAPGGGSPRCHPG